MSHNTRPNPVRRLKIPASSYSPAREGGIEGLSFFLCFHVLCVPFLVLTNICDQDLCPLRSLLLCDFALSAQPLAIDMSNASQGSASSSGLQDPKGPQAGGSLEFEAEMIDADVVHVELPEPGDMQSRLQHGLAALCLRHKPSETIEPRMLRVVCHFTQRYVVGNAHA